MWSLRRPDRHHRLFGSYLRRKSCATAPALVSEGAFSLIETCISISLSALVMSSMTHVFLSCLHIQTVDTAFEERLAMVESAERMLAWDCHATKTVSEWPGNLVLSFADGTTYHYYIDANGVLVRTQVGGGTAVIADDVTLFQPTYSKDLITVRLMIRGGEEEDVSYATLENL
jgi:hypothetical protein